MLNHGELYPVDMVGRPRLPSGEGPRYISVPRDCWPGLLDLGRAFGWLPAGTVVDDLHPPWGRAAHCGEHVPDYKVPMAECAKMVTAEDASRWAQALEAARQAEGSPAALEVLGRVTEALRDNFKEPPEQVLHEIIEFFRAGAFAFCVTD